MCGIAGILLAPRNADPERLAAIRDMTAALHHRGPDRDGFWSDGEAGVALGHRRLAILDLSDAGRQPMQSHGGGLIASYNGEIYNFRDLRRELETSGHRFGGDSDTEVMLAAFEALGIEAALSRFAGMFAIAVWDRRQRALHLVRDRLGKKPLYVALCNGALLFASELKALHAVREFRPALNCAALALLLRRGWIPEQHCIWDGVFKLPPGGLLTIRPDDLVSADAARLRQKARIWWSLADVVDRAQAEPLRGDDEALEDELHGLLGRAVSERMISDVPLGALLSGGIDSSLVVALMQAQSSRPVRTFTIGFAESGYDEAGPAAAVAAHLGTDHTEMRVTPAEARAVIPELPRVWDEPFADESQIPTLLVARLARQYVTVALSGDGGDESFGGYGRHFLLGRLAPLLGLPAGLRRAGAATLGALRAETLETAGRHLPMFRGVAHLFGNGGIGKLARVLDAADEATLYERMVAVTDTPALAGAARISAPAAGTVPALTRLDLAGRAMFRDTIGYLPSDILVKVDRASMAVSLETRSPLLDHRVVEWAWRAPMTSKLRNGRGKLLLRRMLRRYVPEPMFERPKHGFDVPIGAWLRGPLREWASDLLSPSRLRRQGLLDVAQVRASWAEHLKGTRDRANELWAILMFQAWLE
ncbi:MAG: asparagine synthase (glutamine-hydrolyzing), partial [Acetobacteraceae bacterium]|nr:asparagine synthase (glutamine-hydrolyzing) [Acetobacteraceae bacterium]